MLQQTDERNLDSGFHAHLQQLLLAQDETSARVALLGGFALRDVAGIALVSLDESSADGPRMVHHWGQDLTGNLEKANLEPRDLTQGAFRALPRMVGLWFFRRRNPFCLSQIFRYVPFSGHMLKRALSPPGLRPIDDLVCIPYRHHDVKCIMGICFFRKVSSETLDEVASLALAYMVKWELAQEKPGSPDGTGNDILKLTDTELECLRWMAAGKTLHEISEITGMSYPNVRYHLNKAKERSGYATTQQLMVRAALDYDLHPLGPNAPDRLPH